MKLSRDMSMRLLWVIIFLVSSFFLGMFIAQKKYFPYYYVQLAYRELTNFNINFKLNELLKCKIEEINQIPMGATVLIGHAYGSQSNTDNRSFLNENVTNFIKYKSHLISTVIFTGDIFNNPSISRWDQLANLVDGVKIHVAPGNHDTDTPANRDVFNLSVFGQNKYPQVVQSSVGKIILEDSISTNWAISNETVRLLNASTNKVNIIARHNIPIQELLPYANSKAFMSSNLDNTTTLNQKITSKKNIWIIGDTGAYQHLPRIACFQNENHIFILSGTGGFDDDVAIVLSGNKIFSIKLLVE